MSDIVEKLAEIGLTEQQKRFCEAFLLHFDPGKAFKEAFPTSKVHNPLARGRYLLKNPRIKKGLEIMRKDVAGKVGLRLERVLKEQMAIAFANMKDVADWNVDRIILKDSGEISEAASAAIMELRDTKEGVAVRMHPKKDALEALMKFLKAPKSTEEEEGGFEPDVKKLLADPKYRFLIEEVSRKILALPALPDEQAKKINEIIG